ncbi:TolC family protein [Ramlibacter rhizophilus]|uniref:TolC family protein n=1 Tax=Ramlibacter rhizophilus TaxID=1781167 RepID=A0A4Z0BNX2_9BURK|nr:TolC family protein [Ramlibacter rhizophilus]TFY99744.1 TolC family protein [Ramlibacter rhizophilus]
MRARRHAGLGALLLVAGCALPPVGPARVQAPDIALAPGERFRMQAADAPAPEPADLHWWRRFDDPQLARWVEQALDANTDIAIARQQLAQARALLLAARAARGPRVQGQAELELRLQRESGERRVQPAAGLALDWDLDPWGGLRLAEQAAEAGVLRAGELVHAQRLAAAGLAARAYLEWRLALHDHRVLARTAEVLQEGLRVTSVRVEAGISPVLDRERARAELAVTEAALAAAAVRAGQALAALQVLAGERPQPVAPGLSFEATQAREALRELPALEGAQPVAAPLDLLRLRPDLRAAQQALVAAAAEVGVAEVALRPRLRLPGTLLVGAATGGAGLELLAATLAALVEAPLLDGGEAAAGVGFAQARLREAELRYRQQLLLALRQVEDALLAREGALARITAARRGTVAANAAQEQAQTLYRVGLTNYLDVVDAQRTALTSERLLIEARAESAAAAVRAFEAMGLIAPP